jgi:acyl-CoA thioester hydrolase
MIEPLQLQLRFADLDILGHVNNSVYLTYFELARLHYFKQLLGDDWDWKTYGMVLVKNEIEYLHPVVITDQPIIYMTTEEIGNKSFVLSYKLVVKDRIFTKGLSKQVCYNSYKNESIVIPQVMKTALISIK